MEVFEKREYEVRAIAATNIYFLYFIEINFNLSGYYADISMKTSRYNTKAPVNKGNCLFINIFFTRTKEIYL